MKLQTQPTQSATQPFTTGLPRCNHRTPAGRHCRAQARDTRSGLCPRHYFRPPDHQPDPALAAELLGPLTDFNSASDVTDFLSRLLILQARDRISPRRAAVMAYTCNLLLRGLRAVSVENRSSDDAEDAFPESLMDLVRRKREIAAQRISASSATTPVSDSTGAPIKPS